MEKIINLYKPIGMTPLETIRLFKKQNNIYEKVKVGYAGRLDPMAEGVLLLLVGDENKKINNYFKLDKEYHAKVLLGFISDTYDILGIAKKKKFIGKEKIKKLFKNFKGECKQEFPIFSSYKIKGKPLFYYALNNKLSEIKIPEKNIEIKEIKINSFREIDNKKLLDKILRKISLVKGNFRQEKIKKKWKALLVKNKKYFIFDFKVKCSSGTYIRSIANKLDGVLFNLIRTKIGKFDIKNSIKFK